MDTHDQFRASEKRAFPYRAATVGVSLTLAAALDATPSAFISLGILAAVYAAYTAALRLVLLPRFRHDAWIYGMLAADSAFAAGAIATFGAAGPALAIPAFAVVQYALFLGRNGAAAAAVAGVASVLLGTFVAGNPLLDVTAAAAAVFAAVAGLAGLIAADRFAQRDGRVQAEEQTINEARASRVLAGILRISDGRTDSEVTTALANAVRTATGFPAAVVLLLSRVADGALVPVAWRLDGSEGDVQDGAAEPLDGHFAAAIAARQGSAIAVAPGAHGADVLPTWARSRGYRSAIVAPITRGLELIGAVYALSRGDRPVDTSELEQVELVVSFAARLISSTAGMHAASHAGAIDQALAARAGRGSDITARPPIQLRGLSLDPATESTEIAGVGVSLSRTEFSLLYALAGSAGSVMNPRSLVESCWEDGTAPNDNAVDVTIYRLRRKLAQVPQGKELIRTVRGKGYMLVPPAEPSLVG